jgi:hypothetical protein
MSHQHALNVSSPNFNLRIVTSVELTSADGRVITRPDPVDLAKALPPGSLSLGFNPLVLRNRDRPTTTQTATRAAANTRPVVPNPSPPPPVQHWVFYISSDLEGRGSAKWKVFLSGATRSIRIIQTLEVDHTSVSDLGLLLGLLILKRGVTVTPGTSPNQRVATVEARNTEILNSLNRAKAAADQVSGDVRMEKFLEFALLELARAERIGLPRKRVASGPSATWVADPAPLLYEIDLLRNYVEGNGNAMRSAWNSW